MLENHLKIALRSIRKRMLHSLINMVGMSVSLTAFILIMLWVQDESSYDNYDTNAGRIYRVTTSIKDANGTLDMAMTAPPLAAALKQLPEVENVVRLFGPGGNVVVKFNDKVFNETNCFYADSTLFDVFTVHLFEGSANTALRNPYSVVLSETMAHKYFGTSGALGKVVRIDWRDVDHDYIVTGVMSDTPENSHFHMNLVASLNSLGPPTLLPDWHSAQLYTYVLLKENTSILSLTANFPAIIRENMGSDLVDYWSLAAQPLRDIHLRSHLLLEIEPNGSLSSLFIFSTAGFLILLIAIINFISLSTARYTDRSKEVGVRRVLGADRSNLVVQFTFENMLLILISFVVAFSATEVLLPAFGTLVGKSLHLTLDNTALVLTVTFFICSLAIVYPALVLSSINPIAGLKKNVAINPGAIGMRRGLTIVQFTIATTLIVCTFIMNDQMHFVLSRDLGINVNNTIFIPLRHPELQKKYEVIKSEFLKLEGVKSVSASSSDPSNTNAINSLFYEDKSVLGIRSLAVDYDFLKTMEVRLISGRDFSRKLPSDSTEAIIVNETAARKLGSLHLLERPLQFNSFQLERKRNLVVGVVHDFNYRPLYYPVEPLVLYVNPADFRFMEVKISAKNLVGAFSTLKRTWDRIEPNYPFDFTFMDQNLRKAYDSYRTTGKVFDISSLLAVFVGCLGLFGLAYHAAEKRSKEIGIRKVLGSSVTGVVVLLSKEFMTMVIAAALIAFPASYWFISKWLGDFSFRVPISPWVFIESLIVVATIAFMTVGFLAIKAATANPVESLRYE